MTWVQRKFIFFLNFPSSNEKNLHIGFFFFFGRGGGGGVGFWGVKNLFYIILLCVKSFFIEF